MCFKQILFAFVCCISIVSCSGSSGGGGGGQATATTEEESFDFTEITNKSDCVGPSAIGDSIFKTWKAELQGSGKKTGAKISFTMRFKISPNSVTISNECHSPAEGTAYAQIDVAAEVNEEAKTLKILEAKNDSRKVGNLTCTIGSTVGTMSYSIAGRCLQATLNGTTSSMVLD